MCQEIKDKDYSNDNTILRFYLTGHGTEEGITLQDGDLTYGELFEETLSSVANNITANNLSLSFIFDASYSGAAIKYCKERKELIASDEARERLLSKRIQLIVITSCKEDQVSADLSLEDGGRFTQHFLKNWSHDFHEVNFFSDGSVSKQDGQFYGTIL